VLECGQPSIHSNGNKDYTYRIGCFKLSRKWNSFQIRMTMEKKTMKKNQCSLLLFSFLRALLSTTWNGEMRNISCRSTTRTAITIKMYQIIFSRGWWEVRRCDVVVGKSLRICGHVAELFMGKGRSYENVFTV